MEIEDRRYWLDKFGKRIWQNKEDYRVRVIRPKSMSKDVIYEKEGKQVGFGSLSDFMVRINEYYAIDRPIEKKKQGKDKFRVYLYYLENNNIPIIEDNVVDYDISEYEKLLKLTHEDGSITYYNLRNITSFKIIY